MVALGFSVNSDDYASIAVNSFLNASIYINWEIRSQYLFLTHHLSDLELICILWSYTIIECSIILNPTVQHCVHNSELSNFNLPGDYLASDLNDASLLKQEKQVIKFS